MDQVADYLILQMEKNGAYLVQDEGVIQKMIDMTIMENGAPSRKFIGKDANYILAEAGIKVDFDVRVIILRADKIHPFVVEEMLMPILPVVTVSDFDEGLTTTAN